MTGAGAGLLDLDPDRVLVAVDAHLGHTLHMAGALALAPELAARAAVVPRLAALDRARKRFRVHVRDHEQVAVRRIGGDAGDETVGIEFRCERAAFLDG